MIIFMFSPILVPQQGFGQLSKAWVLSLFLLYIFIILNVPFFCLILDLVICYAGLVNRFFHAVIRSIKIQTYNWGISVAYCWF
jgi:hypothetical protein